MKSFRAMDGAENVPIIMMTAFGGDRELVLAKEAGVDYFLTKPVKQSLLFDTIMDIFNYPEAMHSSLDEREHKTELVSLMHLSGVRILLAEDNRINQNVARELLESVGIIVEIANNGQEAINILRDRGDEFDAVLMDVQMPVMDGFQATEMIRQNPALEDLPVIAVTAHAMQGDREKCMQIGMNDYVAKPITPELLFSVLTRWTRPEQDGTPHNEKEVAFQLPDGAVDFPDSLPGVHLESGVARMAGNLKAYILMLKDLLQFGDEVIRKLPGIVPTDLQAATREIHTLKGTAANLSAHKLQDVSLTLELFLKDVYSKHGRFEEGGDETVTIQFNEYLTQITESLAVLAQSVVELEALSGESAKRNITKIVSSVDREEMHETLVQLRKMIEEFDPMSEEFWIAQRDNFEGYGVDEEMTRMENHLRNYNFERALEFADRLEQGIYKNMDASS